MTSDILRGVTMLPKCFLKARTKRKRPAFSCQLLLSVKIISRTFAMKGFTNAIASAAEHEALQVNRCLSHKNIPQRYMMIFNLKRRYSCMRNVRFVGGGANSNLLLATAVQVMCYGRSAPVVTRTQGKYLDELHDLTGDLPAIAKYSLARWLEVYGGRWDVSYN
jgi:hypothetical protein